jgi:diguanylate cyclase (GGDEF)-like protein
MFSQAITQHEAVSLDMVLEEKPNDDSPLAVAPVMGLAGRRVLGVLAVWSTPFIKFTPDSVNMIALMADWCGESVDNARVYQQTKDKLIADETIDAYTPEYLRQRLNEEFTRARRYNLSLSLLVLEFPKFQGVSDEDREDVLLTLSLVLKNWTRNIDLLFLGDTPGLFVLLLPNTNLEGARVVARNIMNTFESLKEGMNEQDTALQDIHSGVSAFTPEMKNAEEMLTAAQENASHALHLD